MKTVVVQVEAWLPRPNRRNGGFTKKRFLTHVNLGRWPVLYFDREVIVIKQFGSVSIYSRQGRMQMAGYKREHPKAKLIPEKRGWFSLTPESIKELKRP